MQTVPLGVSSLTGSRLAYGCWRVAGARSPEEITPQLKAAASRAIIAAYEAGYTLFDNANIYCRGEAERLLGDALKEVSGMRERVVIATKGGIVQPDPSRPDSIQHWDFTAKHLVEACEQSLRRLRVDAIDIYMLHRPDYLADPAEVAKAFEHLKNSGKVRWFGISNFRPMLLTTIQAACPMPLITHQVEISLAKLDAFTDGTLDQCLIEKITPMAWSPLAGGLIGHGAPRLLRAQENYQPEKFLPALEAIAKARDASIVAIGLAWLLKHPAKIIPIVGSTNPERIREAAKADDIELTHEEWYRLWIAASGEPLP